MRYAIVVLIAFLPIVPAVAGTVDKSAEDLKKEVLKLTSEKEPKEIVNQTVDMATDILGAPDYDDRKAEMREKIETILVACTSMDTVGQLTLANFKRKFSDEQYKRFLKLFETLLFSTYITHLEKYSGEEVVVKGTEKLTDSRIDVKTDTVTDTRKIPVVFSFIQRDSRWQLYDVHIEGISLIKNYRSQFRELLINRSADEFIDRLEKKVEENAEKD